MTNPYLQSVKTHGTGIAQNILGLVEALDFLGSKNFAVKLVAFVLEMVRQMKVSIGRI